MAEQQRTAVAALVALEVAREVGVLYGQRMLLLQAEAGGIPAAMSANA